MTLTLAASLLSFAVCVCCVAFCSFLLLLAFFSHFLLNYAPLFLSAGGDPFSKTVELIPLQLAANQGNWRGLLVTLSFLYSSDLAHVSADHPQVKKARETAKNIKPSLLAALFYGRIVSLLLSSVIFFFFSFLFLPLPFFCLNDKPGLCGSSIEACLRGGEKCQRCRPGPRQAFVPHAKTTNFDKAVDVLYYFGLKRKDIPDLPHTLEVSAVVVVCLFLLSVSLFSFFFDRTIPSLNGCESPNQITKRCRSLRWAL
jgi:hypothetical protein